MSTGHGEKVMQKPIGEYAAYLKNLIPADIPDAYELKPMFKNISSEENIRSGVIAFRDFLYVFCDRLISDGHLYVKPQNTRNPLDYPFLNHINQLLLDIGYDGRLNESGESLFITEIPSFTARKPQIPVSKQMEYLRFLALCDFTFTGIDLDAKTFHITDGLLEVTCPNAPMMPTGLKALSIAAVKLWVRFHNNADKLYRFDYRVMKAEDTDVTGILKDIIHSQPENIQRFALELHQRYMDMGMTCTVINDNATHFAYAYTKNSRRILSPRDIYSRRVWEFDVSLKYGYCLVVRTKHTDRYADVIETFPIYLREKIAAGYGCDRKLRNEPCQGGCQGIRIPIDDSTAAMKRDIELWLDHEQGTIGLRKKRLIRF
ncbi:hypothetical protein [Clostridium transplantifaecale]|uniref:hypothetical protein n=1 Tax=Clostridium transplantifaecale TaxID=2479838 RepID=UPI000F62C93A|nr:hypothetical protein [Clostridium transplantifaecale]